MALTLYDVTWIRLHAFSERFPPAATRVTVMLPRQDIYAQLALTTYEWGGGVGLFFRSYSHAPAGETIHVNGGDPILNTLYLPHAQSVTAELNAYRAWAYACGTILHLSAQRSGLRRAGGARAAKRALQSFGLVAHDARTGRVLLRHQFIAARGALLPSPQECGRQVRSAAARAHGLAAAQVGIIRCVAEELMQPAIKVDVRHKLLVTDAAAYRRLANLQAKKAR